MSVRCLMVLMIVMHLTASERPIVYPAKKVITMNPAQPEAEAVIVYDGKILSVGNAVDLNDEIDDSYIIDYRFEDDIIVPGFIEAHMHPQIAGFLWQYIYVGYFDRYDPDGNLVRGCKTKEDVLDRIALATKTKRHKNNWIIAWGYQSEFYDHASLTVEDLDPVAGSYNCFVENAHMHAVYLNSHALQTIGVTPETDVEGVEKQGGKLTGVLLELKAMNLVLKHLPKIDFDIMCDITWAASRLAQRVGVTTMADAACGLSFLMHGLEAYQKVVPHKDFPQRVALFMINHYALVKGVDYIKLLQELNTDKLWVDAIKFLTDGSLHCHTAHLQWPFYHHCGLNGMENISLEELKKQWHYFHEAGLRVAVHANGDQAIEQALRAAKYVLNECPRFDHRHSLEHNQMVTEAQLDQMQRLGVVANFFVNHIYFWGDLHVKNLGFARAARLNPLASALRNNIRFSIHSDDSVTPVDPLFSMWVAVNRLRSTDEVLGQEQCISPYDALRAVTLDAAFLLGKEDKIGSIEVGKYADFTILGDDPLAVDPRYIKDIEVKATMLEGKIFSCID